jgi:hypothetical protein
MKKIDVDWTYLEWSTYFNIIILKLTSLTKSLYVLPLKPELQLIII